MKKYLILFASIFFFTYSSNSKESQDDNLLRNKEHNKSFILFYNSAATISDDYFKFLPGFQIYFSPDLAFRTYMGYYGKSNVEPDPNKSNSDRSTKEDYFGIGIGIKLNIYKTNTTAIYFGSDGVFTYISNEVEHPNFIFSDPIITTSKIGLGMNLTLGYEVYPIDNFSISTEFRFGMMRNSGNEEIVLSNSTIKIELPTINDYSVGINNLSIIVNYHF